MTYVMMIEGAWQIPIGDPELLSVDGQERTNLSVVLSPSWTSEDRRRFGIYDVVSTNVPEGYEAAETELELWEDGQVHEHHTIRVPVVHRLGLHRIGGNGAQRTGRIKVERLD